MWKSLEYANSLEKPKLGSFEGWITGFMLDPLFFLISRLSNACSPDRDLKFSAKIIDIEFILDQLDNALIRALL